LGDHFYVVDIPGWDLRFVPGSHTLGVLRDNFREFLRVNFQNDRPRANAPSAEQFRSGVGGVEGSRASDYYAWFSRTRIIRDEDNNWVRSPDVEPDGKENAQNTIDKGSPEIGTEP
jgi:hypothetical protein